MSALSFKKMFRIPAKLRKWQPGKTLEKIANFVPGGNIAAGLIKEGINIVKGRTQEVAAGEAYVTTAPTSAGLGSFFRRENMPLILAVAGGGLLLVMFLRRR